MTVVNPTNGTFPTMREEKKREIPLKFCLFQSIQVNRDRICVIQWKTKQKDKEEEKTAAHRVDHTSTDNFYDKFSKSCQILKRSFDLRLLWKKIQSLTLALIY